ncbi:MAG: hypF1 [Comamonadaceae bacterium]|nr:MAG: hypF1 [Comamonadaceae bacterium]
MARILACGAFLKNAACLLDTQAPGTPLWSAVHGDLSDPAACVALEQSVQALLAQAGGPIDAVAHDLHPDFFSTHLALLHSAGAGPGAGRGWPGNGWHSLGWRSVAGGRRTL